MLLLLLLGDDAVMEEERKRGRLEGDQEKIFLLYQSHFQHMYYHPVDVMRE